MSMPIPSKHLLEMAIEPKLAANQEMMMNALQSLASENSSFHADPENGQIIITAMSEQHLDDLVETLRRQHKIVVNIGAPQVSYRETITKLAKVDYTHKRQTGGADQFAQVKLVVEPGLSNSGLVFENKVIDGAVPEEYLPGVEKGVQLVLSSGNIIGFPVVDVKVTLLDGAFHEVSSSATAFEIASRAALREALTKAGPVLLEPVMKVETVSPEEYLVSVISDLKSRRGQITGTTVRGITRVVNAMVPLANMFSYMNDLRPMTQDHATFAMQFDHYEVVDNSPNDPNPDDTWPAAMAMRA